MVLGNTVGKLKTFVWILNHVSRSITWSLISLKALNFSGQMTTLNMFFHVVVSVHRFVKIWNSSQFPAQFQNVLLLLVWDHANNSVQQSNNMLSPRITTSTQGTPGLPNDVWPKKQEAFLGVVALHLRQPHHNREENSRRKKFKNFFPACKNGQHCMMTVFFVVW